jgi:hypothetical protein
MSEWWHESLYPQVDEHSRAIPSPTTVVRHRLTLVFAWYATMARHNKRLLDTGGCVTFASVDASPQGGYDYIMRYSISIAKADLSEAFEASLELCRNRDVEAVARREVAAKLSSLIRRHVGCVTAVGSGRSGLNHKLACFMHSLRVETLSWADAVELASSTVSITTDLGTESKLGGVRNVRLGSVFPWLQGGAGGFLFGVDGRFAGTIGSFIFTARQTSIGHLPQ